MKAARRSILLARDIAQNAKKDDVCIYSFTQTYGEMIPADEFIEHMDKCLLVMDAALDKEAGDKKSPAAADKGIWISLMTLNF